MRAQELKLKAIRREKKLQKKRQQKKDNRRSIFLIQKLSAKPLKSKKGD